MSSCSITLFATTKFPSKLFSFAKNSKYICDPTTGKVYEIPLNPSRFDIIKSRLEASQYVDKYYMDVDGIPNIPPPEIPAYAPQLSFCIDDNIQKSLDYQMENKRHSDEDSNLDVAYSKCGKIKI